MHKSEGCHAFAALQSASDRAYLSPVSERQIDVRAMKILRNIQQWRRYRQTCVELNRLSNRELADLGISRSEIATVARLGR